MPIREFFHFMQIVDDFDAAAARYDALLAPHIHVPKHWSDFDKRWAFLAVIGPDFVFELMEPSKTEADRNQPLPKFFHRHGSHFHSFSWFVDSSDIVDFAKRLAASGVRVVDAYGVLENGAPEGRDITFFTHPKDTFGQLEFQGLSPTGNWHNDPHLSPDWTGAYWRDEHPLGIERTSHLTTIVADLDRAKAFYEQHLDAPAFHEETGPDRRSAFALVGTETVVELAQPTSSDSALARDLAAHGELPHAMTFKVRDLDAVERHARSIGVGVAERTGDTVLLDPADLFNGLVAFTTRQLPNDPRR